MALGILHQVKAEDMGLVTLAGYVTIGAAGVVTAATSLTPGFVVARTAEGKYSITPNHAYSALLYFNAALYDQDSFVDNIVRRISTVSNGVFSIQVRDSSDGSTNELANGDVMHLMMIYRAVAYGKPSAS